MRYNWCMRSNELSQSGVYAIRLVADSSAYIGVTGHKSFHSLFQRHRSLLRKGRHFADELQRYYNSGKPVRYSIEHVTESLSDQKNAAKGYVLAELESDGFDVLDIFTHPDVGFVQVGRKVKSSFTLSEEVLRNLEIIADANNLSKSRVIEMLISAVASGDVHELKKLSTTTILRRVQF